MPLHRALVSCPLFLLLACGGGQQNTAADSQGAAQPPAKTAPADDSKADAPEMPALPEMSSAMPEAAAASKCEALLQEGMSAAKAGDHAGAADKLRAALEADPGNPNVRYELARSYAAQGELPWAITVLDTLARDGSPSSINRLLRAKSDPSFSALRDNAEFAALLAADQRLPSIDDAAAQLEAWVAARSGPEPVALPPMFDARRGFGLALVEARGEGEGEAQSSKERITDLAKFDAQLTELRDSGSARGFVHGETRSCENKCCTWDAGASAEAGKLYLSEVCFQMLGERVLHVSRLQLTTR